MLTGVPAACGNTDHQLKAWTGSWIPVLDGTRIDKWAHLDAKASKRAHQVYKVQLQHPTVAVWRCRYGEDQGGETIVLVLEQRFAHSWAMTTT